MAYATYTFYTTTYGGKSIASTDWSRLSEIATQIVDNMTFGRAADTMEGVAEDSTDATVLLIRKATCAVADEYQRITPGEGGGEVAGERVGNHSVEYVQNSNRQMSNEAKLAQAAKLYLGRTGLMYAGFREDEYGLYAV